ncbi:MAG: sensor histidine kinase [Acidobacteria bacterium]|nr:sensor histidine kinase [Acidobacteriota bacterium]
MLPTDVSRTERPAAEPTGLGLVPHWQFSLAMFRLLLGIFCSVLAFAATSTVAQKSLGLWILYTFYALAAVFGRSLERRGYMLLSLLIDTVFFLICTALPLEYNTGISSLFYLFILMSAALLHTPREIFAVVLATTLFLFLARPTENVVLSPGVLLSGTAVTVMALQRQALQDRLRSAAKQAMMFRSEAEYAREAERQRIAHDFHDGPLQCFVGFQMRLQVLRKMLDRDPPKAVKELEELQVLARDQGEEIRQFVRNMRPPEIDGAGLVPSIKKLVEGFEKDSGIVCTLVGTTTRVPPDTQSATEILQIVREGLHNVQKHSQAKHVTVGVGRDQDVFELSLEDDGKGFPFAGAYSLDELELLKRGPVTIRSRVRNLKGELLLDSEPGRRTALKIRIPL